MSDPELWPARSVAEYAYCPRLFYYMAVEGIFVPSSDTEAGKNIHRRVDRPSRAKPERENEGSERPQSVRSLALTSTTLGLTATLDLAEITGNDAVPVEYRKGRPKHVSLAPPPDDPDDAREPPLNKVEAWPTDRVQVGLQALLLKEAGYTVPHAVLYYAAEKRRIEISVDEGLLAEARIALEAARICAQGPRPLPLVNDPRCQGCSLAPICLPDEINQQRSEKLAPHPRRLWPPRDDGLHVVAQQDGMKVGIRGESLRLIDADGTLRKELPLANVESMALLGSVQVSTQALQTLADKGIPVAFLSAAGRLVAMVDPLDSVSADVQRAQVHQLARATNALELASKLIVAKITNQRTMLMRNHDKLPEHIAIQLEHLASRAENAASLEILRGLEGESAALYFAHFAGMFKGNEAGMFKAHGRQRRPPPDPINACLSLAYSLLTHECVAALRLARLLPAIGALHVSRPGRPALALDLMEPFRPLVADSVALSAFNRSELTAGHYQQTASGCLLTPAGRAAFFGAYGRRMDSEVTHPVFGYKLSYRRMLGLHARMIAAWLMKEIPTLAFLTTR